MRKKLIITAIVLFVAIAVIGGLATFWTEYQWFLQLGFGDVYVTQLLAKLGTGFAFGLAALFTLGLHVLLIKRFSEPRKDWKIATPEGDVDLKEVISKVGTPVVVGVAVLVAGIFGYLASRGWQDTLKFFHQTPFGVTEPILNKDVSYYLFALPFLQWSQEWLAYLMGGSTMFITLVYLSREAIVMKGRLPEMSKKVRAHILVTLSSLAIVIGWGYYLERFETLFSKRGVAYGATYTDVNANLIFYWIMVWSCLLVAAFLIASAVSKHHQGKKAIMRPLYAIGSLVVLYVIGTYVWPTIVQRVIVAPNELEKERPYLAHAIAGTRTAYGLDKIQVKEFSADSKLTNAELKSNKPTIDNIKIWDHRPLRQTYQQVQAIRLYYGFPNISVDRYRIGDNYWQVMLSARELLHGQLPAQSQTWVNRHLQYTHGYGACLSPVNQSTEEGLPDLWLKDIPPEVRHPDLKITRPEIYYGLETKDYVLVKTTTQEFDYPKGKENRYTQYTGKGGVSIGNFFRRLLFAIRFGDVNLIFTSHLTDESRILFNRTIQERVRTVAPFLMLDQEPYITAVDGRMFWIQDAYTISYRYPYSQPTKLGRRRRINYIRNSVKVVIDAFHGDLTFYVWDKKDPLIQTYVKIFPALFKDASNMPANLRRHTRYPKDLFTIQASMYESFHMTDPRVFYNQEDKWNIARELAEKTVGRQQETGRRGKRRRGGVSAAKVTNNNRMSPYYMIMRLPEEKQEEFLLMVPFTPTNKDNMVAWMTARCDQANQGKLLVYTFPKKKLVFGPMQIEARIDQDDHISQWITLRNQQGSTVIRGDLLVIPIENSLLYVEPIYLESTQTKLPELKQVIVAFDQRIAMRRTLDEALAAVFSSEVAVAPGVKPKTDPLAKPAIAPPKGASAIAAQALEHYRSGQSQLAKGDWAAYGEHQKALRADLERLAAMLKGQLKPKGETPADGSAPPKSDDAGQVKDLVVVITADGKIQLAGKVVDAAALQVQLKAEFKQQPNSRVVIQANSKAHHRKVVAAMDAAKAAGFKRVGIASGAK